MVAQIDGRSIEEIFGWPDNLKVRSSMTLFARATDDNGDFVAVLDKFYGGEEDPATLARLPDVRRRDDQPAVRRDLGVADDHVCGGAPDPATIWP